MINIKYFKPIIFNENYLIYYKRVESVTTMADECKPVE